MFYLFAAFFIISELFLYAFFRGSIYDYLRLSRVSKTYISKNRKGIKNYWLYSQIHKEHSLGILYYLNTAYIFSIIAFLLIIVFLGHLRVFRIVVAVLSVVMCLIEIPCGIFAAITDCKAEYGKPFVLFAPRKETKKIYSSVVYIAVAFVPAFFVYFIFTNLW